MRRLALLAAAALAGCIPEEGPMMSPGNDCLSCHSGDEARTWTVAGTVHGDGAPGASTQHITGRQGSNVSITDATGWSFTIRANQAGNFYTAEGVRFPLRVAVDGESMTAKVTDGSCNNCHGNGPGSGGEGGGGG